MGPAPGLGGAEMLVPATGMKKEKSLQIPAHELLGRSPESRVSSSLLKSHPKKGFAAAAQEKISSLF